MEKFDVEKNANGQHPGVSGKARGKKNWVNLNELKEQKDFLKNRFKEGATDPAMEGFETSGTGRNQFGRSDISDQQEAQSSEKDIPAEDGQDGKLHEAIKIALQRNPETDLAGVNISVLNRDVTISGSVMGPKEKRAVEAVVRNVPRVKEVYNLLEDSPKEVH